MGKSREMRLARLCCCCCLLYQLGVLSNGMVSGKFWRDLRKPLSKVPSGDRNARGSAGLVQPVRGEQGSGGS